MSTTREIRAVATQATPTRSEACANCGRAPGDRRDECEDCPDQAAPTQAAPCVGCEGKPSAENNPCTVCSKAAPLVSEQDERALFEAHLRSEVQEDRDNGSGWEDYAESLLKRAPNGDYSEDWIHFGWKYWQARAYLARTAQGYGAPEYGDDLILIPRGLIGAACYAVRKLNPESKLLTKLREYTTGSKSTRVALAHSAQAAQGSGVHWEYCPECGSYETEAPQEGCGYSCASCGQEWHGDINYTDVVRKHLAERHAASPAPSAAPAQQSKGIYVASRASVPARPQMWRSLRVQGWPIVSTWIDEAGEGETGDFTELWQRIHDEIAASCGVILYAEKADFPLKGAFIECGIALGMGKPVAVVLKFPLMDRSMRPLGSWGNHPLVKICQSLDQARRYVESASAAPAQVAQGEPVRYELRIRAPNGHCGPWYEVVDMTFKRFTANPDIGDGFTYEARALGILAAPVAPSHQNGDKA